MPTPDGIERISVLPDQLFRAWVGPDDTKYKPEELKASLGRIGTLVFSVNRKPLSIDL